RHFGGGRSAQHYNTKRRTKPKQPTNFAAATYTKLIWETNGVAFHPSAQNNDAELKNYRQLVRR
ncbi:MAG: hypothetical protein AB1432_16405, partial [Bacteroidota bacterium]